MEDRNCKVFNMIKGINESETLVKHISCKCRRECDGRNCNLNKNEIMISVNLRVKKPIKHRVCEEDYARNTSICGCECEKDYEIGKHLKDCTCMKSLVHDLEVISDEILDTPETASKQTIALLLLFYQQLRVYFC